MKKQPTNRAARYCKRWGRYVREIRQRRRFAAYELAEKANIHASYVTLIERDGYVPKQAVVERLAKALEADRDYFLGQAGYATPAVFNAWLRSQGLKPIAVPTTNRRREARKQAVNG